MEQQSILDDFDCQMRALIPKLYGTASEAQYFCESLKQPGNFAGVTLRPYQLRGVSWLAYLHKSNLNAYLCDEMGLGKTLMTLAFLSHLKEQGQWKGPALRSYPRPRFNFSRAQFLFLLVESVLCPRSTTTNWRMEISRSCGHIRILLVAGPSSEPVAPESIMDGDIVVAPYESVARLTNAAKAGKFHIAICDEFNRSENDELVISLLKTANLASQAMMTVLIAGTQPQNIQSWAITFALLFPRVTPPPELNQSKDFDPSELFHRWCSPLILRRTKSQAEDDRSRVGIRSMFVPMTPVQRSLYEAALLEFKQQCTEAAGRNVILNFVMELRKIFNHPFLFKPEYFDNVPREEMFMASHKLTALSIMLERLKWSGNRVVIFASMTRTLDILGEFLTSKGHIFARIEGITPSNERTAVIDRYDQPDSDVFVLLASTRVPIQVSSVDTIIFFDKDESFDRQNTDRLFGSDKVLTGKCLAVRLLTENSVEAHLITADTRNEFFLTNDVSRIARQLLVEIHKMSSPPLESLASLSALHTQEIDAILLR